MQDLEQAAFEQTKGREPRGPGLADGARRLSAAEIDGLLGCASAVPRSAAVECEALSRALGAMPVRRRAMLEASVIRATSRTEIARRFGVCEGVVDAEFRRALEQGLAALRQEKTTGALREPPLPIV